MIVDKPLIARSQPTSKQLFRVSVNADWISQTAQVQFYSVTDERKKLADHAKCIIKFVENNTWLKKWKRNEYLIQARIDRLHSSVEGGQSHKIKRGMAYKLFSALVEYDQKYRGMEEVTLDSAAYEATARVKFQASEQDGNYYFSPYWIDSLGHLAGFTMNANDAVDSKTQVFVNHGWESMRCATRFSAEKTYKTYVKMQNVGGTMFSGDVYIFEEGTIVAVFSGIKVRHKTLSGSEIERLTYSSFKEFHAKFWIHCYPQGRVHRTQGQARQEVTWFQMQLVVWVSRKQFPFEKLYRLLLMAPNPNQMIPELSLRLSPSLLTRLD